MVIYVVKRGESLYDISQKFQTPMQQIININELDQPERLVVGQALVIPSTHYRVQPGESLYLIGQKFDIPYQQLAEANNISLNTSLQIGQLLTLPQSPKVNKSFNAYIEPYGETVSETLEQAARSKSQYLTYLAPFSFRINRNDGTLIPPPLNNFAQITTQNRTAMMMAITNLEEGAFSADLGRKIVTDAAFQDKLLTNIITTANNIGFQDIHFDFEFLPEDVRENYNTFLRKAKDRLSNAGFMLSTALAPKTSGEQTGAWYTAHDYAAHGDIVDFVVIMTYEWGYSGGPPMAVSPIGPVRDVLEYAISVMPSEKIFMGQNTYGYDWTLPYQPGGEYAKALSPKAAVELARDENVAIQYDEEAQAPFFFYNDDQGRQHEVWFEDARSIQAKFDLVKELNLRGVSYWKLGLSFPQNWALLNSNFNVVKLR